MRYMDTTEVHRILTKSEHVLEDGIIQRLFSVVGVSPSQTQPHCLPMHYNLTKSDQK